MEPFRQLSGVAVPLVRANVDTDAIIPSREMKAVSKTGLAEGLFAGWRYREIGGRDPDPDFVLNRPEFADPKILLGGENFGCGSSREHAVWALAEYGFRAVVAPSFSPIFFRNCIRNGVLPVRLPIEIVESLAAQVAIDPPGRPVAIDLETSTLTAPDGSEHRFEIDPEATEMLLEGLDAIDLTLKQKDAIERFVARDRRERPWIYLEGEADRG
ncbi:MAG TPA: 3-isopropylmalate dehydratase small subunit [Steroidobacteraceae bacterium]|nr:3-isopropylmalate dehydratase small subunit [Steroidobacteraceae bacterium]